MAYTSTPRIIGMWNEIFIIMKWPIDWFKCSETAVMLIQCLYNACMPLIWLDDWYSGSVWKITS